MTACSPQPDASSLKSTQRYPFGVIFLIPVPGSCRALALGRQATIATMTSATSTSAAAIRDARRPREVLRGSAR